MPARPRIFAQGSSQEGLRAFQVTQLKGTFESFGALIDFLSRRQPFARFELAGFVRALQHQLTEGNNVAAVAGTRLVGYCGWLPAMKEAAEAWIDGGPLTSVDRGTADAVVLTVVAGDDRLVLQSLLRRARDLTPGLRVYFKRQYEEAAKPTRKSSVKNMTRP